MKFEKINACPEAQLPQRSTMDSVGYDFYAREDITVPAFGLSYIYTGVKCYLDEGYWLMLAIRSSAPKKLGLCLANGIGVIDRDYVDNPDNEGEIIFQVYNLTPNETIIHKGDRIGQGIICKTYLMDDDNATGTREGGFGSTGK